MAEDDDGLLGALSEEAEGLLQAIDRRALAGKDQNVTPAPQNVAASVASQV